MAAASGFSSRRSGTSTTGRWNFLSSHALSIIARAPAARAASRCAAVMLVRARKLALSIVGTSTSGPEKKAVGKSRASASAATVLSGGTASACSNALIRRVDKPTRCANALMVSPRRLRARVRRDGVKAFTPSFTPCGVRCGCRSGRSSRFRPGQPEDPHRDRTVRAGSAHAIL